MIKEKIVTETRTIEEYFCDVCGMSGNSNYRIKSCEACGKHVCFNHQVIWYTDKTTGDSAGDYPDVYCKECDEKIDKYIPLIRDIEEKADAKIEALLDQWKKECTE